MLEKSVALALVRYPYGSRSEAGVRTVFPAFTPGGGVGMRELQGAADILMMPDASTFRILPWAPDTGWMLCDLRLQDGGAVPFDTRNVLRNALEKLGEHQFIAGLEVEFHVYQNPL